MVSAINTDAPKSRSQKKREAERLQKLGCRLTGLTSRQLLDVGLPGELVAALETLRNLTRHGAVKRQQQRIGTLMRELDASQLLAVRACLKDPLQNQRIREQVARLGAQNICLQGPHGLEGLMAVLSPEQCKQLHQLVRRARQGFDPDNRDLSPPFKDLVRFLATQCGPLDLEKHLLKNKKTP